MFTRERAPRRRPRKVYEVGSEPDPRFTLANERTFLAWLRTALALMAAGVGIETASVLNPPTSALATALAVALLLGGIIVSVTAFTRWARAERALRTGEPLPAMRPGPVLGYGLGAIGVAAVLLLIIIGI